jgi:hypothetical protein
MNITRYKCPVAIPYKLNNSLFSIRPISQNEISEAEQFARAHCPDEKYYHLERAVQILSAATGCGVLALRKNTPNEIYTAYSKWVDIQNESTPDAEQLREYASFAIYLDSELAFDGFAAYHSQGPSDYYGSAVGALTAGQLIYFVIVKNAYARKVESEQKVTKTWLEKMKRKWGLAKSENGKL